jgi:uncharacterized protein
MIREEKIATTPGGKRLFAMLVAAAVSFGSGIAPALAAPLRLPPIVRPASQEHHPGKVIFQELVTPDIAAAKRFYGGLFGWSFREIETGGIRYAEALMDGRSVAGLMQKEIPAGQHRIPAWLTFIAVRDVDAAAKTAATNGAKILLEPRMIPERGKEAVFLDPQGAVFAVLASGTGDPADLLADYGGWVWSSLAVPDADKDADFYQKVFGYEVFELPSDPSGGQHLLLASENYARASVNQLPAGSNRHPHWLNYIRVKDAGVTAAKAVTLGGRVLVEPRPDRHGGKLAIIADPQGAALGIMEWRAQGEEVVK